MEKIKIWGEQIPFNSPRSKLDDMLVRIPEVTPDSLKMVDMFRNTMSDRDMSSHSDEELAAMIPFLDGIRGDTYRDTREVIDTFTYLTEIRRGYGRETYEDEPYLVPFPVEGSKRAVIVVPGGGFSYKQSDFDGEGHQAEGDLMARELNKAGITAFILWYRTNPYCFPIPGVDMQRAIRFVRCHAAEYGYDPNRIGAVGFSGGGFEIAGHINLLRGRNVLPADYVPDAVDAVSDTLQAAGLVYPCLGFQGLVPMLNACFPAAQMDTEEKRQKLYHQYSCVENFSSADVPQFVCYGGKDEAIPPSHVTPYLVRLQESGADYGICYIPEANHGFGASPAFQDLFGYWITEYLQWLERHL